jgi:hypothetical protein
VNGMLWVLKYSYHYSLQITGESGVFRSVLLRCMVWNCPFMACLVHISELTWN